MHTTLGHARGSRGIQDDSDILRIQHDRIQGRRALFQHLLEYEIAGGLDLFGHAPDHHDPGSELEVGFSRLHGSHEGSVDDEIFHFRIVGHKGNFLSGPQRRSRNRNGPDFLYGKDGDDRLRRIHQTNANPILHIHTCIPEGIAEFIHHRLQLRISKGLVHELDGDIVTPAFPDVPVQQIVGQIQFHGSISKFVGDHIIRPKFFGWQIAFRDLTHLHALLAS